MYASDWDTPFYNDTSMFFSLSMPFSVQARNIAIVILQETRTGDSVRFSGYHPFVSPNTSGTRGLVSEDHIITGGKGDFNAHHTRS